jgi:hypothetical protein
MATERDTLTFGVFGYVDFQRHAVLQARLVVFGIIGHLEGFELPYGRLILQLRRRNRIE